MTDSSGVVTANSLSRAKVAKQPSLFRRIFAALASVSAVVSILVLVIAIVVFQRSTIADASGMLKEECDVIATSLNESEDDFSYLESLEMGDTRITYIAQDGTVLFDNENDVASMPNHLDRPEVAEAFSEGTGASERKSETEGKVVVYRARLCANGNVVRLEIERESVLTAIERGLFIIILMALGVVTIAWILARIISSKLMRPIMSINPANPDISATYVELNPVVEQISSQMQEIRNADLMRREFTSNVTHELKTPLSSISGAAELIRDGIARPGDVSEFAARIYDEAAHMTDLVNDILTLSKLDEAERSQDLGYLGQFEPLDLRAVAVSVVKRLEPIASKKSVTLSCTGEPVVVAGIPRLLDDLIFNLVDNAIRYNREGGRVDVQCTKQEDAVVLSVKDTGVGIPEDALTKVFERFYRVDNSRARDTGGTGLGLAIVKHAAAVHGAEIALESKQGIGTTITIKFPL